MIWGCPKRTQNRSRNRYQNLIDFGPSRNPLSGAFWPPGGCYMASRAPEMVPRRPREPPRRLLYAARVVPAPPKTPLRLPKTPPRLSKSLQDGSVSPRALQESAFESPSRLQELSGGASQASNFCPATSSLWLAGGLGGKHEALTITNSELRHADETPPRALNTRPKQ